MSKNQFLTDIVIIIFFSYILDEGYTTCLKGSESQSKLELHFWFQKTNTASVFIEDLSGICLCFGTVNEALVLREHVVVTTHVFLDTSTWHSSVQRRS